ncbi:MAG: lysophospholipid acyltransferase family protein [Planctomycetota bacterium]
MFYIFCHTLLRIGAVLLFGFRVHHYRRGMHPGGWLLLGNHQSHLDPVLHGLATPAPISFMARDSLFHNRLFAGLIRGLRAFPVQRGKRDEASFRITQERIANNSPVVIFGEGTRSNDGKIQEIKGGIEILARRTKAPIIPFAVAQPILIMPRGRSLFSVDVHHVVVVIGPAIPASEYEQWARRTMPAHLRTVLINLHNEALAAREKMGPGVTVISRDAVALFLIWVRFALGTIGRIKRLLRPAKPKAPKVRNEEGDDD